MKGMLIVAAALCFSLNNIALASETLSIKPGLWRNGGTVKINGQALPDSPEDDEDECVSAEEAKDLRASMGSNFEDSGCKITSWQNQGDALEIGLQCVNEEGTSKGKLSGLHTATAFDLKGRMVGTHVQAGAITIDMHWYGKYVGKCR
ncbi:DUF3617 domain-containing protein [Serratia sp. L9]|uniref:DUF3617 domain-containing protein n=1 Tax=Serratia sp. L9 TaxID=3423946 RepID=UPI003D6796EA